MSEEKSEAEKLRSKRAHALVMMILGVIMAACALAAGLIALHPGTFPSWMSGAWIRRPPEEFRRPGKTLVTFAAWGPSVLKRARAENKLVLLHLTTAWSTPGRVMETTTYADPDAAALIAERFVPARVDADARPDVAARFGVGAWPSTILLLPDGRAVAAAAALPPSLFRAWANSIAEGLRQRPDKARALAADAEKRFAAVRARPAPPAAAFKIDPVWGGAYRGGGEYAKTLADQAAVVASTDAARGASALGFVERFLALPDGGWAAATLGEVDLADGRTATGAYYFAFDDTGRRALGMPALDRSFLPAANAAMARAILHSSAATKEQKARARRLLLKLQK